MSDMVAWIGAEAERPKIAESAGFPRRRRQGEDQRPARDLPADEVLRERVPVKETEPTQEMVEDFSFQQRLREEEDRERERRTYRGRAVAMLSGTCGTRSKLDGCLRCWDASSFGR